MTGQLGADDAMTAFGSNATARNRLRERLIGLPTMRSAVCCGAAQWSLALPPLADIHAAVLTRGATGNLRSPLRTGTRYSGESGAPVPK